MNKKIIKTKFILDCQIVFEDSHQNCGRYSTKIKDGKLQSTICLNQLPRKEGQTTDVIHSHESQPTGRSVSWPTMRKMRKLDPKGYT